MKLAKRSPRSSNRSAITCNERVIVEYVPDESTASNRPRSYDIGGQHGPIFSPERAAWKASRTSRRSCLHRWSGRRTADGMSCPPLPASTKGFATATTTPRATSKPLLAAPTRTGPTTSLTSSPPIPRRRGSRDSQATAHRGQAVLEATRPRQLAHSVQQRHSTRRWGNSASPPHPVSRRHVNRSLELARRRTCAKSLSSRAECAIPPRVDHGGGVDDLGLPVSSSKMKVTARV